MSPGASQAVIDGAADPVVEPAETIDITASAGMSPVRRIFAASRPARGQLWLAAFLGALSLACGVGLLAASAWLISRASQQPPVLYLQVAVVSVRAFALGRAVFRYAERLVGHDAALSSLTDLRVALYNRLEVLSPGGLYRFRSGDLMARLVDDVDTVQDLTVRVLLPWIAGTIVAVGSVAFAASLLPAAGVVLAVALIVGATVVPWLTARVASRAEASQAPLNGRLTAEIVDVIQASADLTAAGAEQRYAEATMETDAQLTHEREQVARGAGLGTGLGLLTQGLAVIAMIAVTTPAVRSETLDGVWMATLVLLPLAAFEAVAALPAAALAFTRVRSAAERIVTVVDAEPAVTEPDPATAVHLDAPRRPGPASGPGHHEPASGPGHREPGYPVRYADVSARYPGTGEDALMNLDLEFGSAGREQVALVGPSGSGKSTAAMVLMRFLDYRGSVTADGIQIADCSSESVRAVVGMAEQQTYVFDSTIAANLRLAAPEADDDELVAALRAVRLGGWLDGLELGLQTPLGAHGSQISSGQRQRLGAARLVLADRGVWVLDEPTEHLDPETARALMTDLLRLAERRPLLVISHRAEGLDSLDAVVPITRWGTAPDGPRAGADDD